LILTTIFYSLVMRRIWSRDQLSGTSCDVKRAQFNEKKKQTIKMLIIVTALFALAYLPTHIWYFIFMYFVPISQTSCYSSTPFMLSYWLGISSAAYNPFIYCYFNAEFK